MCMPYIVCLMSCVYVIRVSCHVYMYVIHCVRIHSPTTHMCVATGTHLNAWKLAREGVPGVSIAASSSFAALPAPVARSAGVYAVRCCCVVSHFDVAVSYLRVFCVSISYLVHCMHVLEDATTLDATTTWKMLQHCMHVCEDATTYIGRGHLEDATCSARGYNMYWKRLQDVLVVATKPPLSFISSFI